MPPARAAQEEFHLCSSRDNALVVDASHRPSPTPPGVATSWEDTRRVGALADSADREAGILTKEIDRLQAPLVSMEYHRDQAVAFSAQQRAHISSIQFLPTETLVQILGYVCAEVQFSILHPEYPAIVVSQVCQRWRNILTNSASLWAPETTISIVVLGWRARTYVSTIKKRASMMRSALDHYVRRSRGRPLDIRFVGSKRFLDHDAAQVGAICKCLAAHASLWRSLHGVPMNMFAELWDLVQSPILERLESLHLDWCHPNKYPSGDALVSPKHTPRLRKVTAPQVCKLDLLWGQLTEIHVNEWMGLYLPQKQALQSCVRLESLRLAISDTDGSLERPIPSVLPKLSWLHIDCSTLETGVEFFACFDAPSLTHLTLRGADDGVPNPESRDFYLLDIDRDSEEDTLAIMKDFTERSQCRLTHLALFSVAFPAAFLLAFLGELPYLEEVEITDCPDQRRWQPDGICDEDTLYQSSSVSLDLFRAMAPSAFRLDGVYAPLVPMLRRFYFQGPMTKAFAEDDMSAILDRLCQSRTDKPLVVVMHGVGTWG
ncbi:uncharacterized protein SCHCODRAFT_02536575 [Schizophyllum commune H4-8]|nr:uncharacterized protein SCHCODRAFT_02536575 [Schizophyllum commune H4-8]KAI5895478.1 hypothetical protein SCHCODRAFT_02536575 [Schizophyllum commune H4-8]